MTSLIEGQIKNGVPSGIARVIDAADGTCYLGQFKEGKRNGKGVLFKHDGTVVQEGIWSNNELSRDQEVDLMV